MRQHGAHTGSVRTDRLARAYRQTGPGSDYVVIPGSWMLYRLFYVVCTLDSKFRVMLQMEIFLFLFLFFFFVFV